MPVPSAAPAPGIAPTGIAGLDDILAGGLARNRLFLIEGTPGTGKTTLALQVLQSAAARGESVLYVTLSETEEELRAVGASHGWTLDGVPLQELIPSEDSLDPGQQYTLFHASEVELGATIKTILTTVERLNPTCIVFDSLSELRLLAGSALRYRRQILALKQLFARRGCTALLLDDMTATDQDLQTQSIAHGVIRLEQVASRLWLRAPPAPRGQVPRHALSRRVSRLPDRARRDPCLSHVWSPPNIAGQPADSGWPATSRSWTRCSAAGSKKARAR